MKKIIPFRKDLEFKTSLYEITSISLEHVVKTKSETLISGNFTISGDYKALETSINREIFDYNIPFDIALGNKINLDTLILDIDDFQYEIKGNILKVNIDLILEAEEIKEENLTKELPNIKEKTPEETKTEELRNIDINTLEIPIEEEFTNIEENIMPNINIPFDNNETYSAYRIYIVKDGDTINDIIKKYNASIEDIKNYNDIKELNPGDKIIIPYVRA